MKTPDVTKVQGGSGGAFIAIVLAAPQAGYDAAHLDVLVIASALVAVAAMLSDALLRRGRAQLATQQAHSASVDKLTDILHEDDLEVE